MKMTAMNSMVSVAVLAIAASLQAQTTVHVSAHVSTLVGTGQSEGAGYGAGGQTVASVKDDLFAGTEVFEKNAVDVTEITMDPDTLAMVNGKDKDKARDTVLQTVRTYEYDKPGMYNIADVDKIRERLNTGDWHCSVRERHIKSGESTDICEKRRTDDLHESAIIEVEPKELTFIHRIGHHPSGMMMPGMGMISGGFGSFSSLATLDPEMLELKVQLNSLKYGLGGLSYGVGPGMMVMPEIDSEAIQKSIDKSMKEWNKSGKKMFLTPDGKSQFMVVPDVPLAPVAPNVPNVPDAAIAPIAPEAPAAPDAPALPAPAVAPAAPSPATPAAEPAPKAPQAEATPAALRPIVPAEQLR